MLNLDPAKLLIIAVVAVILLGPDKLPQVARQAGAAWRSFNNFRHRMESEVRSSIPDLPSSHDIARLARSPSALLEHLSNMSTDGATTASEDGTAVNGDVTAVVEGAAVNGAAVNGAAVDRALAPENPEGAVPNVSAPESPTAPPPRRPSEGYVSGDPGLN